MQQMFFLFKMKYVFWNKTKQISILPLSLYGNKVSEVKYIWGLYSESYSNFVGFLSGIFSPNRDDF